MPLTLKLSHVYSNLPPGGIKPGDRTVLLNYCIARELSPEFREYATKWYPEGQAYEAKARHGELGPGPYLVLFLRTTMLGASGYPHFWATVRQPWAGAEDSARECALWLGWREVIPEAYREARGKEVAIVIEGQGA